MLDTARRARSDPAQTLVSAGSDPGQQAARIVDEYGYRAPAPLKRDFLNSLHAAYTAEEVRQQLHEAGCSGFTVEELGPLHLVAWGYGT